MTTRHCRNCGRGFTPRHPSQKFCSPNKRGQHRCKDAYHNRRKTDAGTMSAARYRYLEERAEGGPVCMDEDSVQGAV